MKKSSAALIGLLASIPFAGASSETSSGWTGEISASQDRVEVGQTPNLNWSVNYPPAVVELVELEGDTVTTKTEVKMDVRVLGAAWGTDVAWYPVEGLIHDGKSWVSLLKGIHPDVDPTKVVHSAIVPPNTSISLEARGSLSLYDNTYWSDWRKSSTNGDHIVTLVNGDAAPQYEAVYDMQDTIEDYLAPVIDSQTGRISIGPRDVIYLVDFNSIGTSGFDLQDIAVLVTFTDTVVDAAPDPISGTEGGPEAHENNGHGNNLDGVDMSNPGDSKTGEDSDPTVDDESNGGGNGNGNGKWGEN